MSLHNLQSGDYGMWVPRVRVLGSLMGETNSMGPTTEELSRANVYANYKSDILYFPNLSEN